MLSRQPMHCPFRYAIVDRLRGSVHLRISPQGSTTNELECPPGSVTPAVTELVRTGVKGVDVVELDGTLTVCHGRYVPIGNWFVVPPPPASTGICGRVSRMIFQERES